MTRTTRTPRALPTRRGYRRPRRSRVAMVVRLLAVVLAALLAGYLGLVAWLTFAPETDTARSADAIVVVGGADDGRYEYAESLARGGAADEILISRADTTVSDYEKVLAGLCPTGTSTRKVSGVRQQCFVPDSNDTRGEARAVRDIARSQGLDSLVVVTYWAHESRVRHYFEACMPGVDIAVVDGARRGAHEPVGALLREAGGWAKTALPLGC